MTVILWNFWHVIEINDCPRGLRARKAAKRRRNGGETAPQIWRRSMKVADSPPNPVSATVSRWEGSAGMDATSTEIDGDSRP